MAVHPVRSDHVVDALASVGVQLTSPEAAALADQCTAPLDAATLADNVLLLEQAVGAGVKKLLQREPRLMTTPLRPWHTFLMTFGFSHEQWRDILTGAPQALTNSRSNLITAGESILELRRHGLDESQIAQMCVFYPQMLHLSAVEVKSLVRMISNHQSTGGC